MTMNTTERHRKDVSHLFLAAPTGEINGHGGAVMRLFFHGHAIHESSASNAALRWVATMVLFLICFLATRSFSRRCRVFS